MSYIIFFFFLRKTETEFILVKTFGEKLDIFVVWQMAHTETGNNTLCSLSTEICVLVWENLSDAAVTEFQKTAKNDEKSGKCV